MHTRKIKPVMITKPAMEKQTTGKEQSNSYLSEGKKDVNVDSMTYLLCTVHVDGMAYMYMGSNTCYDVHVHAAHVQYML